MDPCCGEGIAAATMAAACGLESYGVELDLERANAASLRLDHVVADNIDMVKIAREAFELLWLNPPYDVVQGKRLEHKFLTHCTQFLAPNGLLIYILRNTKSSCSESSARRYVTTRKISNKRC